MTGEDDNNDDDGYVGIAVDEAALNEHLRRYRAFVIRLAVWKAQPRLSRTEALELLEEHGQLIEEIGVPQLTRHLFDTEACSVPLDAKGGYSAAGQLQAASEFLYHIGTAYLGPEIGYLLAGDLRRMSWGGMSLLAAQIEPTKRPFDDLEKDCVRRLVLQGIFLAGRDGGDWETKVLESPGVTKVSERNLRRWAAAADILDEDRALARQLGQMAARQETLNTEQQRFVENIFQYPMDALVRVIKSWREGWRRR